MKHELQGFSFEIQGLVQGVFFRKFTQREATRLGLSGWVANTRKNTVIGQIWLRTERPVRQHHDRSNELETLHLNDNSKLNDMKNWLSSMGSPHCRIDHAIFKPLPITAGSDLDKIYPCNAGFDIRPNQP